MRIPVIFADGAIGKIHAATLDHLITEKDVVAFRRSTGWVQIGRHAVRSAQERFSGPRKRWNDFLPIVEISTLLPSR